MTPASHSRTLPIPLATLVVLLALASAASAQGLRDLVEAALDQQISQRIEVPEQSLRPALKALEEATGLRFVLHEKAVEWMPYGEQTRVSFVLENVSVRQALTRIFDGLGLTLRVMEDKVAIDPAPVLDRLGRRLSLEEVNLLQTLASKPWKELDPSTFKVELRLPPEGDPGRALQEALTGQADVSGLTALESATQGMGLFWVPSGRTVVVFSQHEAIEQRLDRPLDLNYKRVPLDELLVDLGKRIGITVRFAPGALQRVNAPERQVDFVQRGTTVRQVLELIAGRTGLTYQVLPEGIQVTAATEAGGGAGPGAAAGKVVAILRVPVGADGTTIDFLIRDNELPPEFQQLLQQKLPKVIEELRKELQ